MTLARPLADDPVLLGRQREMAALKVVGSGVDASAVGTGKTISSGRALAHRAIDAAAVPRARRRRGQAARPVARGAHPEARRAAGCRRWRRTSSCSCSPTTGRSPGRSAASTASSATGPGWCSRPNSVLDRYPSDLQAIPWHLLIADEALRYANPATEAHQALAQVRFGSVADCWLLTATPRGKSAEHLDVLVGLAVGDRGDDHRAAQHARGRRPDGRDQRPPAAGQLRPAPRPRHPPRHAGVDARGPAGAAARARPRPRAARSCSTRSAAAARRPTGGCSRSCASSRSLEAGSELYKQALAELARAQGVVLGNVGVFVDASVDPETLTHSKAALATALVRQGLVAEAIRGGGDGLPLLRGVTAQTLAGVAARSR